MKRYDFVIIGAGLGGLATALRLSHLGKSVLIVEKTNQIGGRNRYARVGECEFDGGPTLMMMLEPFRKLFSDVGERLEDHLDLRLCEPSYRVFYADGHRIEGSSNPDRMAELIEREFTATDAKGFRRLLDDLEALYADAIPNFVRKNFYSPLDFFGLKQLGMVARHGMLSNFAKTMGRYFSEQKLRMLFSFQTMYLGLSPYDAPWVYAVLTYMEYGEGIYYPMGGMPAIGDAVAKLAVERGTEIRLECSVKRVKGSSVELEDGTLIEAGTVISNADLPYTERNLIESDPVTGVDVQMLRKIDRRTYSCSAHMLYIDYEGSLPELLHHNVFFGRDFKGNLDSIFHKQELPEDPAFYACVTARTDERKAPQGHENLYLLIPCPNLERPWTDEDAMALEKVVFDRLSREIGFDPSRVKSMVRYSPKDWRNELNLDRGAAFGLSHHFHQSAFFRPTNRSKSNPDVYFVGASTVPGNGLPMVLISSELVVDRLKHDGRLG